MTVPTTKFDPKTISTEGQNTLRKLNNYINRYAEIPIVIELIIEGKSLTSANMAYHLYTHKKSCEEEAKEAGDLTPGEPAKEADAEAANVEVSPSPEAE